MKNFVFLIVIFSSFACSKSLYPQNLKSKLKPGDLIFQDLDCGDICTAIEKTTLKKGFSPVSHVAVVEKVKDGKITLVEALGSVKRIGFQEFVKRSKSSNGRGKIIIYRLKKPMAYSIPFFLDEVRKRLGKPYDKEFKPDNGSYYCSELISDSFKTIGKNIFPKKPMNFGKKGSWEYKIWEKYYEKMDKVVPYGEKGTNPADFMVSPHLKLIYNYKK
jgi:Permuted papain-like amidase enzyme, YaeF/YiiX, C92 family